jgi:hypothetical protein
MSFLIHPAGLAGEKVIVVESPSPAVGQGWRADTSEFDSTNPDILESISTSGTVRTFVLDLARLDRHLGQSPFEADVSVVVMVSGRPGAYGAPNPFPVRGTDCQWDNPAVDSPDHSSAAAPPVPAPSSAPPIPVSGADSQGFLNYPDVRCDSGDHAAMVMRTTDSLVVVCRAAGSSLYYKGMRLSDSASIRLDGATSTTNGYTVTNPTDGTRYELTRQGLVIVAGGQLAASEDAVESAFL